MTGHNERQNGQIKHTQTERDCQNGVQELATEGVCNERQNGQKDTAHIKHTQTEGIHSENQSAEIINHIGEKAVRQLLSKHNIYPKKNFGQNFLTDRRVVEKIIKAADIRQDEIVIEIGPGLGALTAAIAHKAAKVVAIEIDSRLVPILRENIESIGNAENTEIICQDILKTNLDTILGDCDSKKIKVLANLPYYITTPIIFKFLESHLPIQSMVLMVQKEVGQRMMALPKSKAYSALTVNLAYYAKISHVANVPPNCFFPRPDVDSAVVKLDIYANPPVQAANPIQLFSIIRAAFSMRRKTLQNCFLELGISKETTAKALQQLGLTEHTRGEELYLQDFANLADLLLK